MGRYVPPELEGTISANKLAGKHALGSRARKLGQGILTVRFEMPFAIWCTTCPKPSIIGQGVRFNAEKKKVGNYHSTPIYSFRMKHIACGGWIEIRTDPKNTAYVVTEGAKKRDTGEDKVQEGEIRIKTDEERERLSNDAFAALEGKVEDKRQAVTDKSRIEDLQRAKERDWDDPGEANRRLRRTFRAERKIRQRKEGLTEGLKDRMSLGMDLLEETEDDRRRAGFVDFGEFGGDGAIVKAQARPLFADTSKSRQALAGRINPLKGASLAEKRKAALCRELGNNTRAVLDPFLKVDKPSTPAPSSVRLVKRKQSSTGHLDTTPAVERMDDDDLRAPALVDYDSD
jgi:coiled-coil domain-containing protein 130